MSRPAPMLDVRGLRAGYGAIEVLHGVDLSVPAGGVLAVLGPNGAGKSTLLRTIAGLHPASGGEVTLAGRRVNDADPTMLARSGLCLVPEGRGVFPNLTVRDNLQMATYRGLRRSVVEQRAFSRFPRLAERADQLAGTMSGGEQQMLALARAVATDPAVLLVDELSMGLAPLVVAELFGVVADLAAAGVTVVVVEQFAAVVLGIADVAAVLVDGHVVRTGAPAEVEGDLADIYLGRRPTATVSGSAGSAAGSSASMVQSYEVNS